MVQMTYKRMTADLGKNVNQNSLPKLGTVVRTVFLLKFLSDVKLREIIHRSTNKVEQYNAFEDWITFASAGTIYERAYVEQEKRIKYTGIIANCIMLDNTAEISDALNALAKEGLTPTIDELAALSPYQTRHIKHFGNYELDLSAVPAPITDDLTFAIEPPPHTDVVETGQDAFQ